jgi:hypothetical protein
LGGARVTLREGKVCGLTVPGQRAGCRGVNWQEEMEEEKVCVVM